MASAFNGLHLKTGAVFIEKFETTRILQKVMWFGLMEGLRKKHVEKTQEKNAGISF